MNLRMDMLRRQEARRREDEEREIERLRAGLRELALVGLGVLAGIVMMSLK